MASPSCASTDTSALHLGITRLSAAFGSTKQLCVGLPPSPVPVRGGQRSSASHWPGAR